MIMIIDDNKDNDKKQCMIYPNLFDLNILLRKKISFIKLIKSTRDLYNTNTIQLMFFSFMKNEKK